MQNTSQQVPRPTQPAVRRGRPEVPPEFKAEEIEKLDQAALIAILKEPGTEPVQIFRKGIASKRLAVIGTKEAVPALAALLSDDRSSDYARDTLECMPDPAAGEALIAALPKLKGLVLVGAINSLFRRREAKAVEPLGKLVHSPDAAVAKAAALALGEISGPAAAKTLREALARTKGPARANVGMGALVCADRMMAEDRKAALALLELLSRPDMPASVRLPAMHLQLAAATSISRPRT
jgi:HEAT repeat protein